jgi:hypothetical protein
MAGGGLRAVRLGRARPAGTYLHYQANGITDTAALSHQITQ